MILTGLEKQVEGRSLEPRTQHLEPVVAFFLRIHTYWRKRRDF